MHELIIAAGIPSALVGLLVWWFKRYIDKRDAEQKEREQNTERLIMMIVKTSRATSVLAEATARAVKRIPDARCNGDMDAALEKAARIQEEEKDFLFDQGVKRVIGDT